MLLVSVFFTFKNIHVAWDNYFSNSGLIFVLLVSKSSVFYLLLHIHVGLIFVLLVSILSLFLFCCCIG